MVGLPLYQHSFYLELTCCLTVAREVGTRGNLGVVAKVDDIDGTWQEITNNVNTMVRISEQAALRD